MDVDLYALTPEEFTAARDAAAKQDPALKKLRRPSVAAWVVNTLVREQADLLDQVLALGEELAQAQGAGQGAALRELTEQRHQLVQAVTRQAVDLVDREVSAQVRGEVAATLEAALADPASAEAVRSGQLVRSLSYAGFGGSVDLDGAVAPLPAKPRPKGPSTGRPGPTAPSKRLQKLESTALDAQGDLDTAVRHAERVARDLDAAEQDESSSREDEDAAAARVRELQEQLAVAEAEHGQARSRRTKAGKVAEEAHRKADRARKAVGDAQDAADAARKALDDARRA